ncbi:MAG: glycosyltransferase family 2 protein [Frankiales bacterium]|nr:glycosyltransferase family 2 protein [Frankiales bacterium]
MPLVSVVVPVYNVAPYVERCLDSILAQTWHELDIVIVDDGSTDGSGEIAASYADRDRRVRVVRTDNHGLGHARNVGLTHTRGEFLCFADSDDVVPFRAYELLHSALDKSGSDFATGNFRRLTPRGTRAAKYVGTTYSTQRLGTHITRHRDLIVDRTAWNKMFRREFWEQHRFAFAEGVQYEDQYATLPAHFLAASVDVVSSPIYFWRIREDESSISQRREEPQSIADRLAAIAATSRFLADRFPEHKGWYEQSVLAQDLSYFLDAIVAMSDADRRPLLAQVGGWLDHAASDVFHRLPAIRRIGWHLARAGKLAELAELLRFERDDLAAAKSFRQHGSWYADYPFRGDRAIGVPDELYRIDDDLRVDSVLTATELTASVLRITGRAALQPLDRSRLRAPHVEMKFVATGSDAEPVTLQTRPAPLPAYDETGVPLDPKRWRGFVAELDLTAIPTGTGRWVVETTVQSRGTSRTTRNHLAAEVRLLGPHLRRLDGRRRLRVELTGQGELALHLEKPKVVVDADVSADVLTLTGTVSGDTTGATVEVTREAGRRVVASADITEQPSGPAGFVAHVPLAELVGGLDHPESTEAVRRQRLEVWELALRVGGAASRLAPPDDLPDRTWSALGAQWRVEVGRAGRLVLVHRAPRPVVTAAVTDPAGLRLQIELPPVASGAAPLSVVLDDRSGAELALPVTAASYGADVVVDVSAVPSGRWDLLQSTESGRWPLAVSTAFAATLPIVSQPEGVLLTLGLVGSACPVLLVARPHS